jgi:cobalamin biosynthesis protein CobC
LPLANKSAFTGLWEFGRAGVSRVVKSAQDVDHGGGVDAAAARFGGARSEWIDLSTGINPRPYPLPTFAPRVWSTLPDHNAMQALEAAARAFWQVPDGAMVLAAPGASALIARIPLLAHPARVRIAGPTYNEHSRAFRANGWSEVMGVAEAAVIVRPNNPDGALPADPGARLTIIDESFGDVMPEASLIGLSKRPGTLVLKSFGKFWGLAGLRLGFAIGAPDLVARLGAMLGPWPVSGPALAVGTLALQDQPWAEASRARLAQDAARLDGLMCDQGHGLVGGTSLFRLYDVGDAKAWQDRLARAQIWSRIFPYSTRWLRLGLPDGYAQWSRLTKALTLP